MGSDGRECGVTAYLLFECREERDVRRITCDQFEFAAPESEQSLELALSYSRQHPELEAFLAACGASALSGSSPGPAWDRWERVREHLRRFAGLELPYIDKRRVILLLRDDWNDVELAIAANTSLIWYHWSTSA